MEEMWLIVDDIEKTPLDVVFGVSEYGNTPRVNIIYQTKLHNLDFIPSDECVEIRFFTLQEVQQEKIATMIQTFIEQYEKM